MRIQIKKMSSEIIKEDIIARLGFFPPFFEPAYKNSSVLESLWQQTLAAYIENPIPALFKEKLAASLAKFCTVPYCLLCHSSSLRPLGMNSAEILTLLQEPPLGYTELLAKTKILNLNAQTEWPEAGSLIEEGILHCCIAIFLNQDTKNCQQKLQHVLPNELYDNLTLFLAYNHTCLTWVEMHPELNYENDKRVQEHYAPLIKENPKLAGFFNNYRGRVNEQNNRHDRWLTEENKRLVAELEKSQSWLKATLIGIGDAVITTDSNKSPKITFMNPVAERLTGWSQNDASGKPVLDIFNIIHLETRKPAANPIERVLHEGVVGLTSHTVLIARDGTEFIIENTAAPIISADGLIQGVVLVFRDSTKQKKLENDMAAAAQALEREKQNLHDFFMQAPIPMVVLNGPEHVFALANPPYEKLVGRSVHGKKVLEAFKKSEVTEFVEQLDAVFKTGVPYLGKELPLNIPGDNGLLKNMFIDVGYHPFRESDGKIKGVLAIHQDVTDQVRDKKLIEESREQLASEKLKLQTIVLQSPAAIAMWRGLDLTFEIVNPEYQRIFAGRQLIGRPLLEACPEFKDQGFVELLLEVLKTGVPFVGDEVLARIVNDNGELEDHYYDFTYIQIKDVEGNPYGVYDHAVDVTNRVVQKLDLERAKIEAERANQTKSSFLANMSHEIRTPLGAILGFTDLLKDRNLDIKERDQFLDTISRNGKALTRIIDDILDLAKVESGKLDMEKIDFSFFDLLDEVLDLFRERARSKGIYLRIYMGEHIPSRICSDPTRIRQIFINVVGNAVKFTDEGGITIQVTAHPEKDKTIKFKVAIRDTGVGVSLEQKERLFQPFSQADNTTTRKYGGTGLGLVLSQRLANALGGKVTIDDPEEGRGTIFTISFIAELTQENHTRNSAIKTQAKTEESENRALHGVRILVADDSIDNQFLVHRILTNNGAVVEAAKNGLEAFKQALNGNFDIILMDIQMPQMDGYEATRSLREAGYKKPIIALTAHAMAEEKARTRAAGCDGHLTKPLNTKDLVETISLFLKINMGGKHQGSVKHE